MPWDHHQAAGLPPPPPSEHPAATYRPAERLGGVVWGSRLPRRDRRDFGGHAVELGRKFGEEEPAATLGLTVPGVHENGAQEEDAVALVLLLGDAETLEECP